MDFYAEICADRSKKNGKAQLANDSQMNVMNGANESCFIPPTQLLLPNVFSSLLC